MNIKSIESDIKYLKNNKMSFGAVNELYKKAFKSLDKIKIKDQLETWVKTMTSIDWLDTMADRIENEEDFSNDDKQTLLKIIKEKIINLQNISSPEASAKAKAEAEAKAEKLRLNRLEMDEKLKKYLQDNLEAEAKAKAEYLAKAKAKAEDEADGEARKAIYADWLIEEKKRKEKLTPDQIRKEQEAQKISFNHKWGHGN